MRANFGQFMSAVTLPIRWRSNLVRRWLDDRWRRLDIPGIPDRWVQEVQFRRVFRRRLNLKAPQTFNEKIHWLMLYYRMPILTQIADKYAVRSFVSSRVGASLLNHLYGVWEEPEAVIAAFDDLPESFVLKVTSGSNQNILCRDKSQLDVGRLQHQLSKWMRDNTYWACREWAYKNIVPRVICERYLTDEMGNIPRDYKFWCFNGEPRLIQVVTGRFIQKRIDMFDLEWEKLPFGLECPRSEIMIPAPEHLDTMVGAVRSLSCGFPFVRVDMYSTGEGAIFGEMTWYPDGGFTLFTPDSYDQELGEALTLPKPYVDSSAPGA